MKVFFIHCIVLRQEWRFYNFRYPVSGRISGFRNQFPDIRPDPEPVKISHPAQPLYIIFLGEQQIEYNQINISQQFETVQQSLTQLAAQVNQVEANNTCLQTKVDHRNIRRTNNIGLFHFGESSKMA